MLMAGAEGLSEKMGQRVKSSMGGAARYPWRRLATPLACRENLLRTRFCSSIIVHSTFSAQHPAGSSRCLSILPEASYG